MADYSDFVKSKVRLAKSDGFILDDYHIKPHNRLMVKWLVGGGRRACFAAFGLHKTVPYRAILLKRFGLGFELNPTYFLDGAKYCEAAEVKMNTPTLFDTLVA